MVRPWLDSEFPIFWREGVFLALDFNAELAFCHFDVFFLVWVEVQRRLLGRCELDEVRMVEEEDHVEVEGTVACGGMEMGDRNGALESGDQESVCCTRSVLRSIFL